ncbi:hypothetical protein GE061_009375 [Apolygus lucorum]|uniref:Uncharacterized protein n=1 Tax=Apolygus lucorum TaxID=248454 RepID=A0A8S9Y011_APOLU|nr:hypothetical protein GE061_009375 [Apolygus lucorum]
MKIAVLSLVLFFSGLSHETPVKTKFGNLSVSAQLDEGLALKLKDHGVILKPTDHVVFVSEKKRADGVNYMPRIKAKEGDGRVTDEKPGANTGGSTHSSVAVGSRGWFGRGD